MRTVKLNAFLSSLCAFALGLGVLTASVRADVTTERGASILAFPKVMADGATDTIIQITNISNSMVHARCLYVNAQLQYPDLPEGAFNQPIWQETDFSIWLTKQQPTHWRVSEGRLVYPEDSCFVFNPDGTIDQDGYPCDGAGFDPGAVPPVPSDFVGELRCIEVDGSENPIGGNHLKGEATLKSDGDVSKYNAVGIEGTELAGQTGNSLLLDQPAGTDDVVGQYAACPNTLIVNHFAQGVTDPVVDALGNGGAPSFEDPANVTLTELTLVPCQADFENQIGGRVTVQFLVINEYEQKFSASTTVACWKRFLLHEVDSRNNPELSVFSEGTLGTTVAQTRISPVAGNGGVIGIADVLRVDDSSNLARAAFNLHVEGDRFSATNGQVVDQIILPEH